MDDGPDSERVLLVPADAFIEHLTYGDARAILDQAEGLEIAGARELVGDAVDGTASPTEVLDAMARLLASGEVVLLKRDERCIELELPAGFFDEAPEMPSGS